MVSGYPTASVSLSPSPEPTGRSVEPAKFAPDAGTAGPAASRDRRLAVAVAVLIGVASVFSAAVAWRASLASIDSSRLQSLAVQEQARKQQIERELEGRLALDERLVISYQEHVLAARELRAQAERVRASDPPMADSLDLEAHGRSALARSIRPFLYGAAWVRDEGDGSVTYDRAAAMLFLRDLQPELAELQPERTSVLAQLADVRAINLIAIAAVMVAALFFLTIAQVVRTRERLQLGFGVLGGVLVLAGTLGFVLVEVIG